MHYMDGDKVIEGYKIVRGHPSDVEGQVQRLLEDGWQPFGEMTKMTIHDVGIEIVIQCMVLFRK